MKQIALDFETYSEAPLKTVGLHKYVRHPSFEVLCLAYQIDDGEVVLWLPGRGEDDDLKTALENEDVLIYAFNAAFERCVLRRIYKDLGLESVPPISRFVDTMAISCTHSYPQSLDGVAEVLSDHKKDKDGSRIMMKLTKPKKWSASTPFTRWTPENNPGEFKQLYDYCMQDVRAEQGVLSRLPKKELTPYEQTVWEHTLIQNDRGIHVDLPLVDRILEVQGEWQAQKEKELSDFTGGVITTGGQRDRILAYCKREGLRLPSLTAEVVEKVITKYEEGDERVPENVYKVCQFRKLLSKTSTAKFKKIRQSVCSDGTVKGNLYYYGAITGRYGGRGLQIQNLPRRKEKDPSDLISAFHDGLGAVQDRFGDNVMELASKLIRPCLVSPPGYDWVISDYSAIENRVLHWVAGDQKALDEFEQGLDQYKSFAAIRFRVDYDSVNDWQRHHGKTAILGLGYQMGAKTYVATAKGYGVELTEEEAKDTVVLYRNTYPLVNRLWFKLYKAAMDSVQSGVVTQYGLAKFAVVKGHLYMKLPSGRNLCYVAPEIEEREMPWGEKKDVITFMGVNPYSRKWSRMQITPGRLTENLVQAASRDILVEGALNVERAGYRVVGSVHDEVLSYREESAGDLQEFNELLVSMPPWADGLPLRAEGYRSKRYRKE